MNLEIPRIALLAVNFETIVFIVVVLFSIIGGLQNLLKNQQNQPPNLGGRRRQQQPRQPRKQAADLQDEIDKFLEDVLGKDEVDAAQREKEYREKERRRKQRETRRRQPAPPPPPPEPKRQPLSQHHLKTAKEDGVAKYVEKHLPHLKSSVAAEVTQDLGAEPALTGEQGASAARGILSMLSNPAGMRQAILLNEILSPPKCLRDRDRST